jgi:signal transduction histidine kinase
MEYAQNAEELLGATAELLAGRLRLAYVAFEIDHHALGRVLAASGSPVGARITVPLSYQGYPAGELVATGRRAGVAVGRREREVLLSFARHAGAALHTARLAGDLRQSMDRVLYAREDERRRLRHELHDSLGPILAGISLGLHAAGRIMITDTDRAAQLVGHLEGELQSAMVEVRRLFETLRPPVLDQLGLVPAIREQIEILATRMRTDEEAPKDVAFTLDHDDIGTVPAIVEVAAYRIACEALTNVARHSRARHCTVDVRRDAAKRALRVEIADDGIGIATIGGRPAAGLGLGSMRERAAELGGTFVVDSRPRGGTRVIAVLPMQPETPARPPADASPVAAAGRGGAL